MSASGGSAGGGGVVVLVVQRAPVAPITFPTLATAAARRTAAASFSVVVGRAERGTTYLAARCWGEERRVRACGGSTHAMPRHGGPLTNLDGSDGVCGDWEGSHGGGGHAGGGGRRGGRRDGGRGGRRDGGRGGALSGALVGPREDHEGLVLLGAAVRNVEEARDLGLVCMALERGAVAPERGLQQLGQCGRVVRRMVGRRRRGFGEGTFVIAGVVTALEGCSVFTASSGDAEDAANGGDDVE